MRRPGWLTGVALVCLGVSTAQSSALDDYARVQVGSFTSEVQAKQDARYDAVTWHIAEIWTDDDPGERWLYTESWMPNSPAPYMQRISRLRQEADGTVSARRYTLPEAPRYVGAWQEPSRFASLKPAELAELHGCDAVITRAGAGRFESSTSGARCRNSYKNASYAISQSALTADEMINWDRGFDAAGNLVWGPAAGGYRLRRVGETGACVQPVRMLVYGEIRDRKAFGAYVRAIAEAGLYAKTGGYYEAMSPALDVFEGAPPPDRGVVIARFPCLEAAQRFWNSPEYAEIRKLREGIADFEVMVLPVPPIPK
jgi:CpeT protein